MRSSAETRRSASAASLRCAPSCLPSTSLRHRPRGSPIDRAAPFVVPRSGRGRKHPYALGKHSIRADVELRSGRRLRLTAKYLVAKTLDVPPSIDGVVLGQAIASAGPGPLLVRPASGGAFLFGVRRADREPTRCRDRSRCHR